MKIKITLAYVGLVLGCLAIGAYLVVNNHPVFGFLAMMVVAFVHIKFENNRTAEKEKN